MLGARTERLSFVVVNLVLRLTLVGKNQLVC